VLYVGLVGSRRIWAAQVGWVVGLDKGDPARPHGAEDELKVNSGTRERRAYVRFELTGIPAGATGITASLRLYAPADASSSVRFVVSQVATGWSEATLSWNNQPVVGATVATKAGLVSW
jgi:hypothetical protein